MGLDLELLGGDAAHALLDRYTGKAMDARLQKGTDEAAKVIVGIVRREIRSSVRGHGHNPGRLAAKVTRRKTYRSGPFGEVGDVVKSIAQHNHLVIQGHRIVSHAGVDSGRTSRPNPFIDRSEAAAWAVSTPIMEREVFRE